MKKIYSVIICALLFTTASAQLPTALGGSCKNSTDGTLEIRWNALLNCPAFDVSTINEFGFHSAANSFDDAGVDFDAATATTGMRNSGDTVEVDVNVVDYYGLDFTAIDSFIFLFNNGIENSADPWTLKGTDTVPGGFDCLDFIVKTGDLQECAMGTGINQTPAAVAFLDVFPNPALENVTLSFPNATAEGFEVYITNALGQTVQTAFTSNNRVVINRNGLPTGLYFVTLQNEEGYRSTERFQFN